MWVLMSKSETDEGFTLLLLVAVVLLRCRMSRSCAVAGCSGRCGAAGVPVRPSWPRVSWGAADIPIALWCAIPCGSAVGVFRHRVLGFVLSSLSRTPCCSWAIRSTGIPHVRARSIRVRISPYGTCAVRCRATLADPSRSPYTGTHGYGAIASPSSPAWCLGYVCLPCIGAAAHGSACRSWGQGYSIFQQVLTFNEDGSSLLIV